MNYHNITKCDMNNGSGLRVVLWLAGCDHHCFNCQNPITWDHNDGLLFDSAAKDEIFNELKNDYISGITLSGGDPLFCLNRDEVFRFCKEIKENFPDKTIWVYTGYIWEKIVDFAGEENLGMIDVIVDGPYVENLRNINYHWAGSTNQRVIDVKKSLANKEVILYEDK